MIDCQCTLNFAWDCTNTHMPFWCETIVQANLYQHWNKHHLLDQRDPVEESGRSWLEVPVVAHAKRPLIVLLWEKVWQEFVWQLSPHHIGKMVGFHNTQHTAREIAQTLTHPLPQRPSFYPTGPCIEVNLIIFPIPESHWKRSVGAGWRIVFLQMRGALWLCWYGRNYANRRFEFSCRQNNQQQPQEKGAAAEDPQTRAGPASPPLVVSGEMTSLGHASRHPAISQKLPTSKQPTPPAAPASASPLSSTWISPSPPSLNLPYINPPSQTGDSHLVAYTAIDSNRKEKVQQQQGQDIGRPESNLLVKVTQ